MFNREEWGWGNAGNAERIGWMEDVDLTVLAKVKVGGSLLRFLFVFSFSLFLFFFVVVVVVVSKRVQS
jgi:hypothetical protein